MPTLEYCELIQQKMMRIQDLEIENKQLRETLNDYNQEFKEVKNQGEVGGLLLQYVSWIGKCVGKN